MIDVTEEMLKAGIKVWEIFEGSTEQIIRRMYRAMRALEAEPEPSRTGAQNVGQFGQPTRYQPAEELAKAPGYALDTAQKSSPDSNDGMSRRVDTLQALVLELARRVPGWGDATIARLLAELEATR
jgi:hypothetical protein